MKSLPIPVMLLVLLAAPAARAQAVLGPGDDATVLGRGMFRFTLFGEWNNYDQRYGASGLEPLGAGLSFDTLGVSELPALTPLQSELRSLSGLDNLGITFGNTIVSLQDRVSTSGFALETGVTSRIALSVRVPYVRTHANAFFNVNTNGDANIAFNPALAFPNALDADTALVNQITRAADDLSAQLAACAGSSAPDCAAINANRSQAQMLVSSSTAFAGGVSDVYTAGTFVPLANSAAQQAIEARVAAFKAAFQNFGVDGITSDGPFAAEAPIAFSDAQRILTNAVYGPGLAPIATANGSHFGDISVAGKLALFDSFGGDPAARFTPSGVNLRIAVGGGFTLPTSQLRSQPNLIDIGTGRQAKTVDGSVFTDLLVGPRFWESFIARYEHPLADDQTLRITESPDFPIAPLYATQQVHRALGSTLVFETSPRYALNEFVSLSAQYQYRHHAADHYTGTFTVPAAITGFSDVALDASTLDIGTAFTEQRFGGGISFSNLKAVSEGKAHLPFDVTYLHQQTTSSGANQPKYYVDQIQLRLYVRIFGAGGKKLR